MGIASVISLLGGLAFFLFGMALMGDSLKKVAGHSLETILARLTSTRLKGVLLGTFVTAVIQSSSATTIMVVGFVNSGIMKLTQAIGIIMGANIGTTATGWILTLSEVGGATSLLSTATIFAVVAVVGILIYMCSKNPQRKNVGILLLALSILMSGMKTMSSAMDPLKDSAVFLNAMTLVSNPFVSLLLGIVITAILQSSSASVGVLQALSVTGAITYNTAIPMVLGMSIGACVPVLLSAIGANINGKRTAFVYLYYNVLGSTFMMVVFFVLRAVTHFPFGDAVDSVSIALFNTISKLVATTVLFPVAPLLEKLVCLTFRSHPDEDEEYEMNLLDDRFLDYPPLAVEQSGKTLELMASAVAKNLYKAVDLLSTFDQTKFEKVLKREDVVDRYEDKLGTYLVKLNARELSAAETRETSKFLHSITDLERISDHAVNLAELAEEMHSKGITFSHEAWRDLTVCSNAVREIMELSGTALIHSDLALASRVEPLEEVVDQMTEELKARHIARLQAGNCTLELGFIYNDCINNFERVADHCSNLAVSVIELSRNAMDSHEYLHAIKMDIADGNSTVFEEYQQKYRLGESE